jgi:hypothetical protein
MATSGIFAKLQKAMESIIPQLSQVDSQTNLNYTSDNSELFGSISGAKTPSKPFIIGFLPPDLNLLNFIPTEKAESIVVPTPPQNPPTTPASPSLTTPPPVPVSNPTKIGTNKLTLGPPEEITKAHKTVTAADMRQALYESYKKMTDPPQEPSEETLALMWSQVGCETGFTPKNKRGPARFSVPNNNIGELLASTKQGRLNNPCGSGPFGQTQAPLNGNIGTPPTPPKAGKYFITAGAYVSTSGKCRGANGDVECGDAGKQHFCWEPIYNQGFSNINEGTDFFVKRVLTKWPGTATAKTPEEYNAAIQSGFPPGSYHDPKINAKYIRRLKEKLGIYQNLFGNLPVGDPKAPTGNPNTTAGKEPVVENVIASFSGGLTVENDTDPNINFGRNLVASEKRKPVVDAQVRALREQLKLYRDMPPLILLINPKEFNRTYEKSVDDGNKGRQRNIAHLWLERPLSISSSGVTAAQYVVNPSNGNGGLNHHNRIFSLSYQNLMSLVLTYRNNGLSFTGAESSSYNQGIPTVPMSLYIYYDQHMYIGSFDNFEVTDSGDKPFNLEYSFKFTVRYDFPVLSDDGSGSIPSVISSISQRPPKVSNVDLTPDFVRVPPEDSQELPTSTEQVQAEVHSDVPGKTVLLPPSTSGGSPTVAKSVNPRSLASGVITLPNGQVVDSETGQPISGL